MKSDLIKNNYNKTIKNRQATIVNTGLLYTEIITKSRTQNKSKEQEGSLPEILFISSYPPRECGIATYSQDLIRSLNNKFGASFSIKVCALESGYANFTYPEEVKFKIDTTHSQEYPELAKAK
jgi:hypothetical protein